MKDKSSVDFDAEAEVQPLTATDDVKLDIDSPPASFWAQAQQMGRRTESVSPESTLQSDSYFDLVRSPDCR